jgi:hypothetical protein
MLFVASDRDGELVKQDSRRGRVRRSPFPTIGDLHDQIVIDGTKSAQVRLLEGAPAIAMRIS